MKLSLSHGRLVYTLDERSERWASTRSQRWLVTTWNRMACLVLGHTPLDIEAEVDEDGAEWPALHYRCIHH